METFLRNCAGDALKGLQFPFRLHLSFDYRTCTEAVYFKDGADICGDPVFSHGIAWYLAARYRRGAGGDAIRFGVVKLPHPNLKGSSYPCNDVTCSGSIDAEGGDDRVEQVIANRSPKPFNVLKEALIADLFGHNPAASDKVNIDVTMEDALPTAPVTCTREHEPAGTTAMVGGQQLQRHERPVDTFVPQILDISVDGCDVAAARDYDLERVYENSSSPKGHALIINNEDFEWVENGVTKRKKRKGTDVDEVNIRALLDGPDKLGYRVRTLKNLTSVEMIDQARKFARDKCHRGCHSCIVVVLSHGGDGTLQGADWKPVNIYEFVECFDAVNMPVLAGKPKIFIIQACRGHKTDTGYTKDTLAADSADRLGISELPRKPSKEVSLVLTDALDAKTHPVSADILIAYATPPKYVSYRNITGEPGELGSWFIQTICKVFEKHAKDESIESMLKRVHKYVAEMQGCVEDSVEIRKQAACYECRLIKDFYFFPGYFEPKPKNTGQHVSLSPPTSK